ncbi:hypothetical protein GPECTOR_96g724 [Gonium pectorale]|uniref:Secretory carrier-associated membrane protein n=1 Tax=Gonium pectorale TaxID=33097 RepID=A0A150G099_GONPE|nr:hypothetical protein GPECTOR_96g724 [Gonium pectorale]|eukprot:KXZ43258.1 hypothetical protein GPECTOR_96g724 [Gonium pectorale]
MLGQNVNQKVPSWFLGLLYLICGVPGSWWLWYKRLYNGAKSDSALGFVGFFLWFAVHTAFCIWAAIAVPFSANQWSFAGFITAMKALDVCNFCGIIYLVGAGLWAAEAAWSVWVITDVFLFFRGKGGIKQAKEQAQKEAALAAFRGQTGNQRKVDLSAALVTLKGLSFINPRGKFDLTFTKEALVLSNAKSSIVVPTSLITHVAILDQLPNDTKKRCLLFVVLDRQGEPVMNGKQRLEALIVQTLESDTLSTTASTGEVLDGPTVAVLCQAVGMCLPSFDNFLAPNPDVYKSAKGHNAVPAIVKVSPGLLFPLAGALLFAERPALFVPHSDVLAVEFRRPSSATFDLVLHVRSAKAGGEGGSGGETVQQLEFSQVDSAELGRLRNYFASSRIQPYDPAAPPKVGAGPSGGAPEAGDDDDDDEGRDDKDDDSEDDDDEDFDPAELQRMEDG